MHERYSDYQTGIHAKNNHVAIGVYEKRKNEPIGSLCRNEVM